MRRRQLWRKLAFLTTLIFMPPAMFIGGMYLVAMQTGLPGRRGGPQDAFRHTYASALTAKYLSPRLVTLMTIICERNDNSDFDQMDRHNNALGAELGVKNGNLYDTVFRKISEGQINAQQKDIVTWLPEHHWSNGF